MNAISSAEIEAKVAEIKTMTKLNRHQQERISYLLLWTTGGKEFELFKKLIHQTPAMARKLMAEEYFLRFKPDRFHPIFSLENVLNLLPPCRSWLGLEDSIRTFDNVFRGALVHNSGVGKGKLSDSSCKESDYWDRMLYLVEALPKRREFSNKHNDREAIRRHPKHGWQFKTCYLCWRTLPVNPDLREMTPPLCFEHDGIPAGNKLYRRLDRRRDQAYSDHILILRSLADKNSKRLSRGDSIRANILAELTSPESLLPNLVKHLKTVGHDGQPESLLRAFHGPFPNDLDPAYREAMEDHFKHILQYPLFIFLHDMALAEAWLRALQTDRRRKRPA